MALPPGFVLEQPSAQTGVKLPPGFQLETGPRAESEGMPGPRTQPPAWAKEYPKVYQAAVEARRTLGPTIEMLGGVGGGVVGTAAGTVASPTVVINPVSGGVAGSAIGYGIAKEGLALIDKALGLTGPETTPQALTRAAKTVGEGALLEAGGRAVVGPVVNKLTEYAVKGAGKVADIKNLPNQLASRIARESFETPQNLAAGRAALQAAPEGATAQQALAGAGVISPTTQAVTQKTISKTMPAAQAAKTAAQETARKSTIQGITPDLDAAISARKLAADPLYKAADNAVVALDDEFKLVFDRIPKDVIRNAANIARMEGRPFVMGKGADAKVTGESLHYIKRALSDVAYGQPATGVGRDTQAAARSLLDDYLKVFETKVPEYGQARRVFSDLSAPVNQAQVLKEMASVLEKPGGGERIGPFLNVLGRGEQAMLKRAGGRGGPRFEALNEVLTPEQLAVVKNVAKQLETEASIGQQISAGQARAAQLIKDELPNERAPNIFNVWVTSANKILEKLGVVAGKRTEEAIAKAALDAKSFDDLLSKLPAEDRIKFLKAFKNPETWASFKPATGKALMGVTADQPEAPPVNSLSPQGQAPVNMLAR